MKYLCTFFLGAAVSLAADFTTGQAARLVIGQTQFTKQEPGTSASLVGGVSGLAYASGALFVADSNRAGASPQNNRVLIYRNVSSTLPSPTAQLEYTQRCPVCGGTADVV